MVKTATGGWWRMVYSNVEYWWFSPSVFAANLTWKSRLIKTRRATFSECWIGIVWYDAPFKSELNRTLTKNYDISPWYHYFSSSPVCLWFGKYLDSLGFLRFFKTFAHHFQSLVGDLFWGEEMLRYSWNFIGILLVKLYIFFYVLFCFCFPFLWISFGLFKIQTFNSAKIIRTRPRLSSPFDFDRPCF